MTSVGLSILHFNRQFMEESLEMKISLIAIIC
jgi:hypothetical protein